MKDKVITVMDSVREHGEDFPVELRRDGDSGRLVICAINEGGHNTTNVDLLDLLEWARLHPDLIRG